MPREILLWIYPFAKTKADAYLPHYFTRANVNAFFAPPTTFMFSDMSLAMHSEIPTAIIQRAEP